jgi:hypothetical protein
MAVNRSEITEKYRAQREGIFDRKGEACCGGVLGESKAGGRPPRARKRRGRGELAISASTLLYSVLDCRK